MEASSLTLFYLVTFFSLMEDVTTEILSELFLNIFFFSRSIHFLHLLYCSPKLTYWNSTYEE